VPTKPVISAVRLPLMPGTERTCSTPLPAEIVPYYTFSASDLALIRDRSRPEKRLGLAVQLAYLRHPSRATEDCWAELLLHQQLPT